MQDTIDQLIINSPYAEPSQHWSYDREVRKFERRDGRRPAGYVVATPGSKAFDDPGVFHELPLVNQIRPRVKAWREAGYRGVTGITTRLLDYWNDPEERGDHRFFFCQIEAIETLVWLCEAPVADRQGIGVPGDGGEFTRLCSKMATGSGKTVVMAMLIAWQILNKATYPNDRRFSKNVFVVAPGLTVKSRLQVLIPSSAGNFYEEFHIVPPGLEDKLRQGLVRVRNWHTLSWETDEQITKKKGVDKRGAKSDEAYVRDVLEEMAAAHNIVVINDEAHHAWRLPSEDAIRGPSKEEVEEATKWVGGLDRIHRARRILSCYDFSATPFMPSGHQASEETLFGWIASDFGLNDAIESGLVKTPRVVIRDDGRQSPQYRSRLYHIYMDSDVRADFNRRAEPRVPLPDLVTSAYQLLGQDWLEAARAWKAQGLVTPPVMISVANRTETAARIKYAFDRGHIAVPELSVPERTLHIDSRVLGRAEAREEAEGDPDDDGEADPDETPKRRLTTDQRAELLRRTVDTVGQPGQLGEGIQNVISVGMLSEGWDAHTVTHIMGLRAFTSQLLCEQVVGRGLRRTSYEVDPATGLFLPEYVNIFGVPFTFLPHESRDGPPPPPPSPKTRIEPVPTKRAFAISWPNVLRIDHVYQPRLVLNLSRLQTLHINALDHPTLAELAPIVDGKPNADQIRTIDLEELGRQRRWQRIVFEAARDVYEQMESAWRGNRGELLGQLVRIVEDFIRSDRIEITPSLFNHDDLRRRILLTLNLNKIVQHVWQGIDFDSATGLAPVFDTERPIRSTGDMVPWFSGKPSPPTERSHINFCVCDSTWEATEGYQLDRNPLVDAWAKNDHLGFEIFYVFNGVVQRYRPDFLIRLSNHTMLVLEVKGQDLPRDRTKRQFLDEWVRAVNGQGGFGVWAWDISFDPADVADILAKHASPKSSQPAQGKVDFSQPR